MIRAIFTVLGLSLAVVLFFAFVGWLAQVTLFMAGYVFTAVFLLGSFFAFKWALGLWK